MLASKRRGRVRDDRVVGRVPWREQSLLNAQKPLRLSLSAAMNENWFRARPDALAGSTRLVSHRAQQFGEATA